MLSPRLYMGHFQPSSSRSEENENLKLFLRLKQSRNARLVLARDIKESYTRWVGHKFQSSSLTSNLRAFDFALEWNSTARDPSEKWDLCLQFYFRHLRRVAAFRWRISFIYGNPPGFPEASSFIFRFTFPLHFTCAKVDKLTGPWLLNGLADFDFVLISKKVPKTFSETIKKGGNFRVWAFRVHLLAQFIW